MALNCENKRDDGEPCGECTSCRHIWSGSSSLDVVEIDAASNRGVDDARELRERALYAPSGDDRYKVYIVDEAHMLTREAWNALLKILEEPPPRVVFVFATTEPQKIAQSAAPVLSRLQRFDLKRIGAGDIRDRLRTVLAAEGVEATDDALAMISRAADGSMRDALSLADQVISIGEGALTGERIREALGLVPEEEYLGILELIRDHRAADVFPLVSRLADAGVDFGVFLAGFGDVLRAQLAVTLGGKAESVSAKVAEALSAQKDSFSAGDLLRMLSAIGTLEQSFKKSGQQQLLVEMLLVRFALLDRTVLLEDLLRGGPGSGAPPKPLPRKEPESLRSTAPAAAAPASFASAPQPPKRPTPPLADARDAMEKQAQSDTRQRITPEALRAEKIGLLRKQDAALGAAIDELDLELLD
jgi:DNA polymerase-3 subunit gamma/tau